MVGLVIALAGCKPDAAPPPDATDTHNDAASAVAPPVEMRDVLETGDGYIIGISYPRSVAEHPRLAAEMVAYAEAARANLTQALRRRVVVRRAGRARGAAGLPRARSRGPGRGEGAPGGGGRAGGGGGVGGGGGGRRAGGGVAGPRRPAGLHYTFRYWYQVPGI